ncbi:hypothetical protein BJ170DRAFT_710762 [Xylariales sp. AK1849]|nr:hypothetical protein BJ170DRAFT_710762 [Xylariales sp. AK1849]
MSETSYRRLKEPEARRKVPLASGKHHIDTIDAFAVLCSLACLIASVVVVIPSLSWAWHLGFINQIVIIGFLLATMNLSSRRLATRLLVILEVRWGPSTLHEFNAISRQSVFVPQTDFIWRFVLFVLICLPLALSVAYKSFTGGQSCADLPNEQLIGHYGLFTRPLKEASCFQAGAQGINRRSGIYRSIMHVATTYWARFIHYGTEHAMYRQKRIEFFYISTDERIISSSAAIASEP